ncbi:MAG: type I-PGING CRISPR-associated protein Cas8c/Csp2 [Prevotellaceae bacterium]|jgi:CRISPR-associated protein Cas8c/Csp2|nr:type I-PGING CRISPR-associated protein Cas8c/Csp2 [Prevotellaceae bacterium]
MNVTHPYIRYAQALIMVENKLTDCTEITAEQLKDAIEKGLDVFRVRPSGIFEGKENVAYSFCKEEKGNTGTGIFLSPNIVSTDMLVKNTWNAANDIIQELQEKPLNKNDDLTMSIVPVTGEYLSFSLNGKISRGKPKSSLFERSLGIVMTLTKNKPCLVSTYDWVNVCLIPDLSINKMIDFISFFKRMLIAQTSSDLMTGYVQSKETGKGKNKKTTYSPKRPLIFKGNFPNPPRSSALGSIALLGAIGEFAKEAEYSEQAQKVLDSLKGTEIYLVKYGGATVFSYNHHVIDLAKESKLKTIIDSLYYSKLYKEGNRKATDPKEQKATSIAYQKFDLFTSRFLQLFNHAAFKDFLAFRAEYPHEVTKLFNTYFIKMEKIDPEIVKSARILGKWLNLVAYFAAKNEVKSDKEFNKDVYEKIRTLKSKVLVELESSTFSAKTGDALIAQAVTRAGRLSGMDAPEGAALFMEKTASGELELDSAKNLLIAFSRLKNKSENKDMEKAGISVEQENEEDLNNE